jgi:4-hydroxythreonine-4-phosphate dehydrogenase
MDKLVFTSGDVNGIGPEIVLKALNKISNPNNSSKYYFFIPENVFKETTAIIKIKFKYELLSESNHHPSNSQVTIFLQPPVKLNVGKATKESGLAAYKSLQSSFKLLKNGIADAVVTAPVSKTAFNLAGIRFPGQTELFAYWSKSNNYIMTFLSRELNVALYSIHVPLKKVSGLIKEDALLNKLCLLHRVLKNDMGINKPKIAILGLNPHAGESGIIGREEIETIKPVLKKVKGKINVEGPFSADAFFAKRRYKEFDLTFGIYHDQVLIPFKYINAGKGVNFTAGLPIIRTSPDHGVAYDIAWKGIADESSFIQAIKYASLINRNRRKHALSK